MSCQSAQGFAERCSETFIQRTGMAGESRDRVSRGGRQMVMQLMGMARQRGKCVGNRRGDLLVQRFGMARQAGGCRVGSRGEALIKFAAMLVEFRMKPGLTFIE